MKKLLSLLLGLSLLASTATAQTKYRIDQVTGLQTALDGKQPLDTDLTAIAGLTSAANKIPYATGSGTWAVADLSSYVRTTLLGVADAGAFRTAAAVAASRTRQIFASDYGCVGDGVPLYDGVFTSGSPGFSSASASFTAADVGKKILLQLSQTSRQVQTIQSVTNSTTIVMDGNATASSSAYSSGITTYGTDNTTAIRSVLTASNVLGGSTIFFEGGIYLITGAPENTSTNNSVFTITPTTTSTQSAIAYSIQGIGQPAFAFFNPGQRPSTSGTIFQFTNQTVTGTDPALIATVGTGYTGQYWNAVTTALEIKNITFRQPANPRMHGVQYHKGGCLFMDGVSFDLDVPYSSSTNLLADPSSGASTAIICPGQTSGYYSSYDRVYIYGYNKGVVHGDISYMGHVVAEMCRIGFTGNSSTNMMHAAHLGAYRCTTAISTPMRVQIDLINIETYRGGGIDFAPSWTINGNGHIDIDNYDNGIVGKINAHTVLAGTGPIQTTVRSNPNGPAVSSQYLRVFDLVAGANQGKEIFNKVRVEPSLTGATPTLSTSGTAGSTSYTYRIAYRMVDGSKILSPAVTITTGNATLTSGNKINITVSNVDGVASAEVYRTASAGTPSTTGLIGAGFIPNSGTFFSDTGLAGDGNAPFEDAGTLSVSGRIGIATTTPTEVLDVNGNINFPVSTSTVGQVKQNGSVIYRGYGTNNFFLFGAGSLTASGAGNFGIGVSTLSLLGTGNNNWAIGYQSMTSLSNGYSNTGFGYQALYGVTSGYNNVAAGQSAGTTVTTGNNNTFLGVGADTTVNNGTNMTALGAGASVTASNTIVLGNTSVTSVRTAGDIILALGRSVQLKEGTNALAGVATLSSGTATVATTAVLTGDRIRLTRQSKGASTALGTLEGGTITNATSFVINSLKADATTETGDVSVIYWDIVRPAP